MLFDLDHEWLMHRLANGRCEQTGIAFEFDTPEKSKRSPWAFSIDRIDCSKGYTKTNSQAVVWAYNAAKGEGVDQDVLFFARCMLGIIPFGERRKLKIMPISRRKGW